MIKAPFPAEEYEVRWEKVYNEMQRRSLDVAVVWGRSGYSYERYGDVLYLVNYYSGQSGQIWDYFLAEPKAYVFSAVILRQGHKPELVADEPPQTNLIMTDNYCWSLDTISGVADSLKSHGITGKVGLVGTDFLPMTHWRRLSAATPDVVWEPCDDLVQDVRVVKSDRELDIYRHAGEIATDALTILIENLLSGKSEADAAGEAAREIVRRGGHAHVILVCHGEHIWNVSSDPLVAHSQETPKLGDLVRCFVWGPMYQGYFLDPGRTFVIGRKPTVDQKRLVEATANIVEQCRAVIKPGTKVRDIVEIGRQLQDEFGGVKDQARKREPNFFGHGVGLFWDPPYFMDTYTGKHQTIEQNMVMSTEAFLALEGVGAAGIEDLFIVTDDGTESLTTTPMLWW